MVGAVSAKMPTFSPADSALLLIDHQIGTMQLIKNIPLEVAKEHARPGEDSQDS